MKQKNLSIVLGAIVLSIGIGSFAQEQLPEVTVKAVKYKYLTAVDQKDAAPPVKVLQQRAAQYDIKTADFYEEEYDSYFVSFYLPDGQILAAYDKDGKLLSTAEKYKDVALPNAIQTAIANRFPNWAVSHDIYRVEYYGDNGKVTKVYKLTLQNGDQRLKLRMNDKGEFLK